jgi:hypothetical protein
MKMHTNLLFVRRHGRKQDYYWRKANAKQIPQTRDIHEGPNKPAREDPKQLDQDFGEQIIDVLHGNSIFELWMQ